MAVVLGTLLVVFIAMRASQMRPRKQPDVTTLIGRRVVVDAMKGRTFQRAIGVLEDVTDEWLQFSHLEIDGPDFPALSDDGRIHRGLIIRVVPERG